MTTPFAVHSIGSTVRNEFAPLRDAFAAKIARAAADLPAGSQQELVRALKDQDS
jgi:hypothetical protein